MQNTCSGYCSSPILVLMTDDDDASHPGPTLRALELLQQERFRQDILSPNLLNYMTVQVLENAVPAEKV
jgi:hypothetical protein